MALMLAAFPLLLLATFVGYVIDVRLHLGQWPSYGQPDPKDLDWRVRHSLLWWGFDGFPVVALVSAGLAALGRVRSREFPFLTIIAVNVAACAALIAAAWIDPGGFFDWFAD